MLSEKGKHATATEKRRFVWHEIVWPLVLEIGEVEFSLEQFQRKREQICKEWNISIMTPSRGLASLIQKGIVRKEKGGYSIHFRLIPYMRLKAQCDYGTAVYEVKIK